MKRRRTSGGSVTGGTGDIKPQILTGTVPAASAADDYTVQQLNLPVPRFGTMKTKATVFELLHMDWYLNPTNAGDTTGQDFGFLATQQLRSNAETSTIASWVTDVADPTAFAAVMRNHTVSTNGMIVETYPHRVDFTDGNGNGIVIATDRLFIHTGGVAQASNGQTVIKLTYRLINVGITEYVGIVQSQQG